MAKNSTKQETRLLAKFFKAEASGGLIMIAAAILALVTANGATADWYQSFVHMPLTLGAGDWSVNWPFNHWINDVLMVLFFLIVGMELKREMKEGFLTDRSQIILPLLAAIGGMAAPAALFLLINHGVPAHWNGWAIPSATDIAFALCVLTLAGRHIPHALKIFLLAIAIFDDLGAILVIAFFYSHGVALMPLVAVALCAIALYAMNRLGVMLISAYIIVGIGLWFALHASGIHTTIGGVMVGMAIPLRNPRDTSHSPLNTCMHFLHPWVTFLILPVFAFTAAGVQLGNVSMELIMAPLVLGIALGLFIGKPIGIFGTCFLLVKSGLATLPQGTRWRHIYGASILAGIGFTMSLFIGMLAFSDHALQEQVKLGVLLGSVLSSLAGWLILRIKQ